MRQAGTFSNREQAQRLVDYLHTQDVSARLDSEGDQWAIWIRDEDQLARAVAEIEKFRQAPDSPAYRQATQTAETLRKQQAKTDAERRKNVIEMRDRWDTNPARGRRPLTMLLIGACVLVGILTELGEKRMGDVFQALLFAPWPKTVFEQFSWSPLGAIKSGEVWRLVTPIFIHFGPWHLVFNMFMFYTFSSLVEMRRGSIRLGLIVLAVAITSNFAQYYFPTHLEHQPAQSVVTFGGMSGVVFGLFGYIWMKSRFDPQTQIFIAPNIVTSLLVWLALGWSGILEKLFGLFVANWVHTVGLLTGMAIGFAPVAWRRLRKQ